VSERESAVDRPKVLPSVDLGSVWGNYLLLYHSAEGSRTFILGPVMRVKKKKKTTFGRFGL